MYLVPDGKVLRRLRTERDLTMDELAELSKVNVQTIWRIERGISEQCYRRTIASLAKALGVEREVLIAPPPAPRTPARPKEEEEEARKPEPLRPQTIFHVALTYRADAGKRFEYLATVAGMKELSVAERTVLGCFAAGVALRFETTLIGAPEDVRVWVYSRTPETTSALREALDNHLMVHLVVRVFVAEHVQECPTVPEDARVNGDIYIMWRGFSWSGEDTPQFWALLVEEVATVEEAPPHP